MQKKNEGKTAFYAGEGVFCYKKMSFGLKNAGATYQRLVDKVFSHQIRRNLEAYVDDMVIKSTSEKEMLKDIQETFERFRSINMKLNPKKCSFGVEEGPFLGHLITKHGIKANPSKVKAVTDLDQPRTLKDIQSLNGKLAALSRFLSKGAERSLAFFKVLKGCKDKKSIQWTTEADKALEKMKKLVQSLPTLTAPRVGETLTMHLAASKESISVVLAAKRNKGWTPIYFISRVLQGAELNYPALEKLVLALVHAARRLRRYFQAHTITILTNTPIKQILIGPKKTGRVAKWAIELGEHDIVFLRREEKETPADFLIEIPSEDNETKEKPKEVPDSSSKWRLYTDGASNSDGSGAGLMLIDPEGKEYTYALRFEFETTNNEAEYEALLAGLRIAQEMEIAKVAIFLDSQLLVNQIKGTFAAKQASIKDYLQKVKTALRGFEDYTVEHVRRNQNKKADALSKLASMTFEHLTKEVLVEVLTKRSIEEKEVSKVDTQERKSWMDPIHEYLLSGLLPEDTREARKIRIQAPQYKLIRGNQYKRSFFTSWLRCVALPQTDEIIKEIHEGSYGFNAEPHSLVVRITKQGIYWPSMHREVAKAIQDCGKCKEQSATDPSSSFSSLYKEDSDYDVARIYIDEIIARNGILHPQADGQSERMIQTLENIIRACVIDFGGSYHSSIWCAPFEALHGRKCRSLVLWAEIGESSLTGPELVLDMTDKVVLIKEKLKSARDRQKSYADKRRKPLEYVRPFEILERIGPVAYRLRLPEELSGVHDTFHVSNLKKCLAGASLHVPLNEIKVDKTLRFIEEPVEILDRKFKSLKCSKISLVKVRWNSKCGPEFTWEREDYMKSKYPQLFVNRADESAN
ncbi:reverse transcriptase domain-containing protein [Tanacetum coccineum]